MRGVLYLPPENQILIPQNFHLNSILNHLPNIHFNFSQSDQFIPPSPSCFTTTSNSTSDEADNEHQLEVIDERKHRRMISNRESARRSRMRKQKHMDELLSQVVRLKTENLKLIDKLNHVCESHDKVVQENASLKEEVSGLHQLLEDLRIDTSLTS